MNTSERLRLCTDGKDKDTQMRSAGSGTREGACVCLLVGVPCLDDEQEKREEKHHGDEKKNLF